MTARHFPPDLITQNSWEQALRSFHHEIQSLYYSTTRFNLLYIHRPARCLRFPSSTSSELGSETRNDLPVQYDSKTREYFGLCKGWGVSFDEELYPYPTHIESESASSVRSSRSPRTRTRHSSRTLTNVSTDDDRRVAFMISSPTVSRTTFFATMFMGPTTPLSADIDRSAHSSSILAEQNSATSTLNRQNNLGVSGPLPWAAGSFCFLISVAVCLWLLRRCRRKKDAPDLSHEYVIASAESSSTLSSSNSLRSLGGDMDAELSDYPRLRGDHDPPITIEDPFAYPASPRQSHTEQSLRGIESDVKEDRFTHIRAAPFPTKADLCRF
ncbi:hypothetical protein FRC16_003543, partial [Serendipita sp. 398]